MPVIKIDFGGEVLSRKGTEALLGAMERFIRMVYVARRFSYQKLYDIVEPVFQEQGWRGAEGRGSENILVVSLDQAGDNILMSAFVRELRRNFPKGRIVMLVRPYLADLWKLCPYINELLVFTPGLEENALDFLQRATDLCRDKLWPLHFDRCYMPKWGDEKNEFRTLAYLSGAARRIGYSNRNFEVYVPGLQNDSGGEELLTEHLVSPPELLHEVERMLYMLQYEGFACPETHTECWPGTGDIISAREMLAPLLSEGGEKKLLSLGIGAGDRGRCYPVAQYLEALRELQKEGWRAVIVGGPGEHEEGAWLASESAGRALDLTGQTSLRELAAVISLCDLYLGNDTGAMHMAAALEVPIVAVFREALSCDNWYEGRIRGIASEYARFRPWQAENICLRPREPMGECAREVSYGFCKGKEEPHCITQVKSGDVAAAVRELWQKHEHQFSEER